MPSSGAGGIAPKRPCATQRKNSAPPRKSSNGSIRVARRRQPGFDIAGALFPAKDTAGDYFDYITLHDGSLGIVLGDVSSHGMGPALLMSETRACLRTLALAHSDAGEMLTRTNRVLAADTGDFHFVTLALVRLDPQTRSVIYASAGQRGYVLHAAGNVTILDSTSIPLGVDAETVVANAPPLTLLPGDVLTFFTDGLVEAESAGRVRFGVGRALEVIRSEHDRTALQIINAVHDEVTGFCRRQSHQDDITVVIVKCLDKE